MALLLIGMMLGVLVGAFVFSKGRSFFKYAEMSRTLQTDERPVTRHRQRARSSRFSA